MIYFLYYCRSYSSNYFLQNKGNQGNVLQSSSPSSRDESSSSMLEEQKGSRTTLELGQQTSSDNTADSKKSSQSAFPFSFFSFWKQQQQEERSITINSLSTPPLIKDKDNSSTPFFHLLHHRIKKWRRTLQKEQTPSIKELLTCFHDLRILFSGLTLFALIILLPIYLGLSHFYKTYTFSYAWSISGVLLTGTSPAIVLFVLFMLSFVLVFMILYWISLDFSFKKPFSRWIEWIFPLEDDNNHAKNDENVDDRESMIRLEWNEIETKQLKEFQMTYYPVYCTHFLLFLIDIMIMGTADSLYVVIVLSNPSSINLLASLALALIRILMTTFLWVIFPHFLKRILSLSAWFRMKFHSFTTSSSSVSKTIQDFLPKHFHQKEYVLTAHDILFLQKIILFNNILLPIFVIMIILPDCFYNTFIPASSINSSYDYLSCGAYSRGIGYETEVGFGCTDLVTKTSYSPPFIYFYSCSSNIILKYTPVYINNFLLIGIFVPLWQLLMKYLYNRYHPMNNHHGTSIIRTTSSPSVSVAPVPSNSMLSLSSSYAPHHPSSSISMPSTSMGMIPPNNKIEDRTTTTAAMEEGTSPSFANNNNNNNNNHHQGSLSPSLTTNNPRENTRSKTSDNSLAQQQSQSRQNSSLPSTSSSSGSWIFHFASFCLPRPYKTLKYFPNYPHQLPSPATSIATLSGDSIHEATDPRQPFMKVHSIFEKPSFIIEFSAYFMTMISFGILFPPLILIGTISVMTRLTLDELLIGRLLYEAKKLNYIWYKKRLEYDCMGIKQLFYLSWQPVLLIASILFAFILFDTWGNEFGWKSALPLTFFMAFSPILMGMIMMKYSRWKKQQRRPANPIDDKEAGTDPLPLRSPPPSSPSAGEESTITITNPLQADQSSSVGSGGGGRYSTLSNRSSNYRQSNRSQRESLIEMK